MIDKKKAYEANRDATVSTKKANRARLVQVFGATGDKQKDRKL